MTFKQATPIIWIVVLAAIAIAAQLMFGVDLIGVADVFGL
jgi:tryptophan-rich sensory protein